MLRRMRREWKRRLTALAASAVLLLGGTAFAAPTDLPTGGVVQSGEATITTVDKTMTIDQKPGTVLIDWSTFDIANGYTVDFKQLASDVAINNVIGNMGASVIDGNLSGAGTIVLINPNGININGNANINVGSLVGTTLTTNTHQGNVNAATVNWNKPNVLLGGYGGSIRVAALANINATKADGYVALIAAEKVTNAGNITAPGGLIAAAGREVKLSYDTAGKINVDVTYTGTESAAIMNSGNMAGGYVIMKASTASGLMTNLINNTGTIQATRMAEGADGSIELVAENGAVNVDGTLKTNGGDIKTEGQMVNVMDTAKVSAKGGTWNLNSTSRSIIVEDNVTRFEGTSVGAGNEAVGANAVAKIGDAPVTTASVVDIKQ